MAKYLVPIYASIGRCIEVEADSVEAAIEAVWDHPDFPGGLCYQCSREIGDLGDWDVETEDVEWIEE